MHSTLRHAAKKVILIKLTKEIVAEVNTTSHIRQDQFGFRSGMGTRDVNFFTVLRVLGERSTERGNLLVKALY